MNSPRYCTTCGARCEKVEPYACECPAGHRNYNNPLPGCTVFVINIHNQVLYGRRAVEPHKGGLNIVGEIMLPGETAEACAMRGCKEEFSIDVKLLGYLGSYAGKYGERSTLNLVFIAEYAAGDVRAGDDMLPGSHHWREQDDLPAKNELAWEWVAEPQALLTSALSKIRTAHQ